MIVVDIVSGGLLGLGVFFALVGSIGLIRLPDFYTRAHAATKPDTLGLILLLLGLALRVDFVVSGAKLLVIIFIVWVANPAASNALGRTALRAGLQPWVRARERQS